MRLLLILMCDILIMRIVKRNGVVISNIFWCVMIKLELCLMIFFNRVMGCVGWYGKKVSKIGKI